MSLLSRDMTDERDALMTHTWPELRRFCRERQAELVEVDLRWGIAEEQHSLGKSDEEIMEVLYKIAPELFKK